ncbi:hypothetical protein ACHMW7_16000 [Aminobacter sp. UC22_36]|uniref:hypothetical protein n=1 Tax=Aminobacter sp. UC22_36 TaxID=3374549 RepID=UPI0037570B9A
MHELDKTGLEAAARAICESMEADNYDHLPENGVVKAAYRQQARDGVSAYLSTTSAGVTEEQTVSVDLMQRVWRNLYFNEDEAGYTFQATLNEVVEWLSEVVGWTATTSFDSSYHVTIEGDVFRLTHVGLAAKLLAETGSEAEAKATAQSDFEARISAALEASRVAPVSTYPGVADAIERLHEAAHRDSAVTISVRAQDLRNVLSALASSSGAPVSQKEAETPCPVCGNEERGQGGYLSCECPSPVSQKEAAHPDDLAVDRFAAVMKAKLAKKREEGRGGWEGPACNAEILSIMLRKHVEKGDPVDVANLAMMLQQRGEGIV